MDIVGAKVFSSFIFFIVAMCFGWLPYWYLKRRFRQYHAARAAHGGNHEPLPLQCLHALASGVLIATCLLHLLPESQEAVSGAFASRNRKVRDSTRNENTTVFTLEKSDDDEMEVDKDTFPVAELLIALGLLFIYMLDTGIKSCSHGKSIQESSDIDSCDDEIQYQNNKKDLYVVTSKRQNSITCNLASKNTSEQRELTPGQKRNIGLELSRLRSSWILSSTRYEPVQQAEQEFQLENCAYSQDDAANYSHLDCGQLTTESEIRAEEKTSAVLPSSEEIIYPQAGIIHDSPRSGYLRSAALIAALCIHSFFDGVMVGLQSNVSVVLSLLLAISLHKSFVAIGLSLSLANSGNRKIPGLTVFFYVLTFAAVAPVGILVSSALLHRTFGSSDKVSVVPACLQAFAVGTFMYVSFMEATDHQHRRSLPAVLVCHMSLLMGFGLTVGLRAALGDV